MVRMETSTTGKELYLSTLSASWIAASDEQKACQQTQPRFPENRLPLEKLRALVQRKSAETYYSFLEEKNVSTNPQLLTTPAQRRHLETDCHLECSGIDHHNLP